MKSFATLLLLGAVSADTCHQRLERITDQIIATLDNYPSDPTMLKAKTSWTEFFDAVDQSCADTEEGFSCQTAKQAQILKKYEEFSTAVDNCGPVTPCTELGKQTAALVQTGTYCLTYEPTMSMISIGFSQESQAELSKESKKVSVALHKMMANPENQKHMQRMMEDYRKWAVSPEAKKLKTDYYKAYSSGKFDNILEELQDAIDSLEETASVDNDSFNFDNDGIKEVVRDFVDVYREGSLFKNTKAGRELVEDYIDAMNEPNLQKAREEQAKMYDSPTGRKFIKQTYNLYDEILDEVEISDWPTN